MATEPPIPASLLNLILEKMHPEQVWLFGSRARGTAQPGSDWDLLVILPDDATDDEIDIIQVGRRLRGARVPSDVIPVRHTEFHEMKHHAGSICRTVFEEGKIVYTR